VIFLKNVLMFLKYLSRSIHFRAPLAGTALIKLAAVRMASFNYEAEQGWGQYQVENEKSR
jgi:hypothetical protein